MAEPSVHGRIHSVFWKGLPNRFCPQGKVSDYTNKNATNRNRWWRFYDSSIQWLANNSGHL